MMREKDQLRQRRSRLNESSGRALGGSGRDNFIGMSQQRMTLLVLVGLAIVFLLFRWWGH